jgi:hypothetical protein
MYLQLMSVEPGFAEVFAEGLRSEGFDAITSPGVSSGVERVLLGPLKEGSMASVKAELEARGLHPFPKRYQPGERPVRLPKPDSQD